MGSRSPDQSIFVHLCQAPWAFVIIHWDSAGQTGQGHEELSEVQLEPTQAASVHCREPHPPLRCPDPRLRDPKQVPLLFSVLSPERDTIMRWQLVTVKALGCGCRIVLEPRPWPYPGNRQELSCSGFSILPETISSWGCPKLASSPSPSSLFGAWDQSTQAPQRGSCFLQTASDLSAQAGVLVVEARRAMGCYQLNPKPPLIHTRRSYCFWPRQPAQKPRLILVIFSHQTPMCSSSAGPVWVSRV